MNLKKYKKIYMVGVKGVGMTAVAEILHFWGIEVVGSDTEEKFFTDEILEKRGVKFYEEFNEDNLKIEDPDLVIHSTAYGEDNPEIKTAKEKNIPILSYPEVLGLISEEGDCIAVCGTHGKTTTTAMLGFVLSKAHTDPTVLVGSAVPQFGGNAVAGNGKNIVVEADEYQNKFLHLDPHGVILTNIEYDHPDFFKSEDEYIEAFKSFIKKISENGFLVACFDDEKVKEVAKSANCRVISYGLKSGTWQASNIRQDKNKTIFDVSRDGVLCRTFKINLLGEHNVLNALAVIVASLSLEVSLEAIDKHLEDFKGTVRRLEFKGENNGIKIIDDYAHHPTEIQATLKAVRDQYPENRLWCIFHPHTFSRTKAFFVGFVSSFNNASKIIVLDIYGSAREERGEIDSESLVSELKKKGNDALYIKTIPEVVEFLKNNTQKGDIVLTMGAGDVWRVGDDLLR